MMVMTAKLNLRKILMILTAAAAVVLSLILLMGGRDTPDAAPAVSGNEARVRFLKDLGWEVRPEPVQSGRVKIPEGTSRVYERYNNLQKSQGYDLTDFAGKKVLRYVYAVTNYPGATEPVYATLLTEGDRIIGGDITDTAPGGKIRGLARNGEAVPAPTAAAPAVPADPGEPAPLPEETEA